MELQELYDKYVVEFKKSHLPAKVLLSFEEWRFVITSFSVEANVAYFMLSVGKELNDKITETKGAYNKILEKLGSLQSNLDLEIDMFIVAMNSVVNMLQRNKDE